MADATGILTKMGYLARTSWDQAWGAVSAVLPFLSESLTSSFDRIQNETLEGSGGKRASAQGNEVINGSTEHHLNYNMMDVLIEYIMGDDSAGVITITDSLSSLFFGFEFEKIAANHRFWSVMGTGFTLSGEKGGNIKLICNWAAKNFAVETAATGIGDITTNEIVKFDQLRFRIADQANAIAAGDEIGIESFEITFDRNMKIDDYESNSTSTEVKQPLEPVENGMRAVSFKIKTARVDSTVAALIDAWKAADTALQADFYFDGTGSNTKLIEFPNIRLTEGFDAPIGGGGILTFEGGFECYRSESGNPMYASGNEMRWTYART